MLPRKLRCGVVPQPVQDAGGTADAAPICPNISDAWLIVWFSNDAACLPSTYKTSVPPIADSTTWCHLLSLNVPVGLPYDISAGAVAGAVVANPPRSTPSVPM